MIIRTIAAVAYLKTEGIEPMRHGFYKTRHPFWVFRKSPRLIRAMRRWNDRRTLRVRVVKDFGDMQQMYQKEAASCR
jgi:hypothetical protein